MLALPPIETEVEALQMMLLGGKGGSEVPALGNVMASLARKASNSEYLYIRINRQFPPVQGDNEIHLFRMVIEPPWERFSIITSQSRKHSESIQKAFRKQYSSSNKDNDAQN